MFYGRPATYKPQIFIRKPLFVICPANLIFKILTGMIYKVIGLMSGSSLDGLDIAFTEFHENGGKWNYEIVQADCYPYSGDWVQRLKNATTLSALDYLLLHVEYGHYIGKQVNRFVEENAL